LSSAQGAGPRSLWSHTSFVLAVVAQFLYVAAQAGIFSFFINYMTVQIPSLSDQNAANLASAAFICFLAGRFVGAGLMRKFAPYKVLALYGAINVVLCAVIFGNFGWLSIGCVFLTYFFMSIMFPTIFALGIQGLGERTKRASAYIVMAIVGGAILPKLMGHIADELDISRSFIVPLVCFAFVAFYGYRFPRIRGPQSPGG